VERERGDAITRGIAFLVLLVPLATALVISFTATPEDLELGRIVVSPPCVSRLFFDRPCPTCGMTRAFAALSHGHFEQARQYNRGAWVVYLVYWVGAAVGGSGALRAVHDVWRLTPRRST
jgi:hypothetical protein